MMYHVFGHFNTTLATTNEAQQWEQLTVTPRRWPVRAGPPRPHRLSVAEGGRRGADSGIGREKKVATSTEC